MCLKCGCKKFPSLYKEGGGGHTNVLQFSHFVATPPHNYLLVPYFAHNLKQPVRITLRLDLLCCWKFQMDSDELDHESSQG